MEQSLRVCYANPPPFTQGRLGLAQIFYKSVGAGVLDSPKKQGLDVVHFRDVREAVPYGFVHSRYTDKLQSKAPHQSSSMTASPVLQRKKP